LEQAIENISEAIVGSLESRLRTARESFKDPTLDHKLNISIDPIGIV